MFSIKTLYLLIILIIVIIIGRIRAQSLFFHPRNNYQNTPSQYGLKYNNIDFVSGDNKLSAWYIHSLKEDIKGTVLHLHGNAVNMGEHIPFISWLPEKGYNVFMVDYSGYGSSQGSAPALSLVYEDSLNAARTINKINDGRYPLYLIGQSLGASLALSIMKEKEQYFFKAAVFDSPFSGIREIAYDTLSPLPFPAFIKKALCAILLPEPFSPSLGAENIEIPAILLHGTNDSVIEHHHSQRLNDNFRKKFNFISISEGEHIDSLYRHDIQEQIIDFFQKHLAK